MKIYAQVSHYSCYHVRGPALSFPPHRHHSKCIGHLTHAAHVSEYTSNTYLILATKTPCSA